MSKITKADVTAAENDLFSAQLKSDVEVLDKLLHNELIAISPTGDLISKEMDLQSHRSGLLKIEKASIKIDELKIFGDTAISIITMTAKGTSGTTPVEGKFRYFRVWQRFDNDLKVVGASFMRLP